MPSEVKLVKDLIKRLDELIKETLFLAEDYDHPGGECPIVIGGFDHYEHSKILARIGKWRWHCPYCGKEFED